MAVQHKDFWEKLQELEKDLASREVQKRRWCSYTEMNHLMNSVQLISIARTVINVSSICLATYAAGIATLLGSTLVAHLIVQTCLPRTSLDTRPPANLQADLTDLTTPLRDGQSRTIDNDDVLPIFNSTCDVTTQSCTVVETDVISSQWWLNSMMTWLPNYHDAVVNDDAAIASCANRLLASNANYSFSSTRTAIDEIAETETPRDYATEKDGHINWEELLDMISMLLIKDLRLEQIHYENRYRSTALRI